MRAGGVAADIDTVGIATDAFGVAYHPFHGIAALLDHYGQPRFLHVVEIGHHENGTAADHTGRGERGVEPRIEEPGATMEIDEYRCAAGVARREYVELLDLGLAVAL